MTRKVKFKTLLVRIKYKSCFQGQEVMFGLDYYSGCNEPAFCLSVSQP